MLEAFEPFHGLLLCEGEDISESFLPVGPRLPEDLMSSIKTAHPSDVAIDMQKDSIEFSLVHRCLSRGIPILGICRGSQIVNVVAGGTIIPDIDSFIDNACKHIDYTNYDGHRHPITLRPQTPMSEWFDNASELSVNSYHHQGIDKLAPRFVPMAHSPDGLIEAFYDPNHFDPARGNFVVGLQFHPERMQDSEKSMAGDRDCFDCPGCPRPYESFLCAASAYCVMTNTRTNIQHEESGLAFDTFVDRASLPPRQLPRRGPRRVASAVFAESSQELRRGDDNLVEAVDFPSALPNIDENEQYWNMNGGAFSKKKDFLRTPAAMVVYSKEDLNRLIRSGASVHGTTLVRQLLQRQEALAIKENRSPHLGRAASQIGKYSARASVRRKGH